MSNKKSEIQRVGNAALDFIEARGRKLDKWESTMLSQAAAALDSGMSKAAEALIEKAQLPESMRSEKSVCTAVAVPEIENQLHAAIGKVWEQG